MHVFIRYSCNLIRHFKRIMLCFKYAGILKWYCFLINVPSYIYANPNSSYLPDFVTCSHFLLSVSWLLTLTENLMFCCKFLFA